MTPSNYRLARADSGRAHSLTEADQRRFGQRELIHAGDREAAGPHTTMMPCPADNYPSVPIARTCGTDETSGSRIRLRTPRLGSDAPGHRSLRGARDVG
jgi:hypothetical protein